MTVEVKIKLPRVAYLSVHDSPFNNKVHKINNFRWGGGHVKCNTAKYKRDTKPGNSSSTPNNRERDYHNDSRHVTGVIL